MKFHHIVQNCHSEFYLVQEQNLLLLFLIISIYSKVAIEQLKKLKPCGTTLFADCPGIFCTDIFRGLNQV